MKVLLLVVLLSFLAWNLLSRPGRVELGPGIMASAAPQQQNLSSSRSFSHADYRITPLANFFIKAKILSREDYTRDREADLSPIDLALGWGQMSDESILENIKITQSNRWYYWWVDSFPIPRREIETHSANMHLIPANDSIEELINESKFGDIIELSGSLVQVKAQDGWRWSSSMTRNDTGSRSCEIIWVERFQIVTP